MPARQQTEITTFTAVEDDWWTPQWLADACREALGGTIGLDPCSCAGANEIIRAERFYTREQNGLAQPWVAHTLFCNPPSKRFNKGDPEIVRTMQPRLWAEALAECHRCRLVGAATLVVKSNLGYNWYEYLYRDFWVCHLRKLPHFSLGGVPKKNAKKGVSVFYFGPKTLLFHDVFVEYGRVIPSERWIENRL